MDTKIEQPTQAVVLPEEPVYLTDLQKQSRVSAIFTVIFSGFALLSDGYQVGVLSLINVCFTKIYGDSFTSEMSTRIGNSLFVGCIIGQISFGFICDRLGRKVGLMITTILVILGAALCAGAYGANGSVEGLFWALTIYRGILGVGVGGEYPCSSASASEAADEMSNSEIYKKNAIKKKVPYLLIVRRYWKYLVGTGGSWFFYNFISYPLGIFAGTILDQALGSEATFVQIAEWSLLLNCFYLPGSISGALVSDKLGRKKTMATGFLVQGILGIFMGIFYKKLLNIFPLFVVLYGIFMAMGEFGPGDMLGLVSAEIYPTAIRGTAYGWSAAIGKLGAFVGTTVFKPAIASFGQGDVMLGQGRVFILGSCLALLGAVFTWFLIPDYSKKALGEEDEDFKKYLLQNGFDLSNFGGEDNVPACDEEMAPAYIDGKEELKA
ncbi:Plasma membrane permease, mediates uptake of glycerophosphoinositol and glycerophosphocholine [Linnemannia elongata]|nr:Plasma membrane permease, mediates uptake of glycerophosphoinositol and glycerophosphocholine [Linnemannia elongata]